MIYWKRALLLVGFILIYFLAIRPVRSYITKEIVKPIYIASNEGNEAVQLVSRDQSQTFNIIAEKASKESYYYKFQFGIFFLIPMVGLIVINADKIYYTSVVCIHLFGSILTFICFWIAVSGVWQGIVIGDLIMLYIVPAFAMGVLPIALLNRNQTNIS